MKEFDEMLVNEYTDISAKIKGYKYLIIEVCYARKAYLVYEKNGEEDYEMPIKDSISYPLENVTKIRNVQHGKSKPTIRGLLE